MPCPHNREEPYISPVGEIGCLDVIIRLDRVIQEK
jgi:hypothetical protein